MRRTLVHLATVTSVAVTAANPSFTAASPALAAASPAFAAKQQTTQGLVAVTDQQGHQILLMDAAKSWTDPKAVRWTWRPPAQTPGWWTPTDARPRRSARSGLVMMTTDSDGFVGEVAYPSGKLLWSVNVGGGQNPHTAELLPNGNIAVAASDGNWLRLFTASQSGARASHYIQLGMTQAHGAVWDPVLQVLWVLDAMYLVKVGVGESAAAPTMKVLSRMRLPDSDGGHDIQPVLGDTHRLWVATGTHVYQYDKKTRRFSSSYAGVGQISRYAVKSIGQNPATGQVLETSPNSTCTVGNWCTDTVTFLRPSARRTRPGTGIYKARWWSAAYQ